MFLRQIMPTRSPGHDVEAQMDKSRHAKINIG